MEIGKMEKYAKFALLISGILLVLVGVPRLILNTWIPFSDYVFYASLAFFVIAIGMSYRTIIDFFTMKTTKHGLNMGTLIFLGLLLMLCVNFIATRYNKSFDITRDRLNSLSLESLEILDGLKSDVTMKVFYQGEAHSEQNLGLKLLFSKYKRETPRFQVKFIDAHKDPSSSEYLNRGDKGKIVIVATQDGRSVRVKDPIGEESVTSSLFRLNRTESKKIYFLSGHGERVLGSPSDQDPAMLGLLKDALENKGFDVAVLNLNVKNKVPEDAALVAIIGPKKPLFDVELKLLNDYAVDGGRLIIAADPNSEHNLDQLTDRFGITFPENYVLTTQMVVGMSPLTVLGQEFDAANEITKKLEPNSITLFDESSEVIMSRSVPGLKTFDLVKTAPVAITIEDLKNYRKEVADKKPGIVTLAMAVEGAFPDSRHDGHDHGDKEARDNFAAVVFGDSDFLSDMRFGTGFNKDLALNTFAYLAGQTNMITIRPRKPKDTKLVMTSSYGTFAIIFAILGPLILLISALVIWFRRRGA